MTRTRILPAGPGVVITERQLLQMSKQIFTDIVDDFLANEGHDACTDGGEHNTDQHNHRIHSRHNAEHFKILVRHHVVEGVLHDLRAEQRHHARDAAEHKRQKHLKAVPPHIFHRPFQVFKTKRGFEGFVHVEFIARHQPSPPCTAAAGTAAVSWMSFCRA